MSRYAGALAASVSVFLGGCAALPGDGFGAEELREQARRACVDYARAHDMQLIEVDRVENAGRGVYDVYLRVRVLLIGSRTDRCTYDTRTGDVIISGA